MHLLEGLSSLIGEGAAYIFGRFVRRGSQMSEKQAQHVGEYIVIALILGVIALITIIYS